MHISSKKMNKTLQKQINSVFYQLIADIKTPEEAKVILEDLLSETEQNMAIKRLAIGLYLDKGRSYENIKEQLKVSSATISTVNERLGNPGTQKALRLVKAEQWADDWSGKISGFLTRFIPNISKE